MKEQTTNIHLGSHFTVSNDLLRSIVEAVTNKPSMDLFLFKRLIAFGGETESVTEIDIFKDSYKIEFKFESSFSHLLKATTFEDQNVIIYRNIFVDLIIYTQKLLEDRGITIDIKAIPFDDPATYITIANSSHLGLGFLELHSIDDTKGISNFESFSSHFPNYTRKHALHLTYWLSYLKTHYPVEFLSSYLFLSYGHLPGLLDTVKELGNTICSEDIRKELLEHHRRVKGFFYPGRFVIWRPSN